MNSPGQKADQLKRWPTGDVDGLAADIGGLVRAEEGDDVGDVFDTPKASQRDVLGEALLHVLHRNAYTLGGLLGHLRLDPTRCHRVHIDVEPPKLQRERPRHRLQTGLCRGVVELTLVAGPRWRRS